MRTTKIELLKWQPDHNEAIEIDWPKVHRTIGLEHTTWLLKQSIGHCQLILEQTDNECRLIAEFYNSHSLIEYHLMWAK